MKNLKTILAVAALATAFTACKKDKDPVTQTNQQTGTMAVAMTNTAGGKALALNQYYKNANGDSISISRLNYYMSNIVMADNTGKTFTETNSYHLVLQETPGSGNFTIANVTAGTYSSMSFVIGVDSAHDVDGAHSGQLDPTLGMFWDWTTGYIMAKMEGSSPTSSKPDHSITYHVGGFSGQYNALRTVTLKFSQPLVVTAGGQGQAFIHADAMSWFTGVHTIKVSTDPYTMTPNALSVAIADNYAQMFGVDSVKQVTP